MTVINDYNATPIQVLSSPAIIPDDIKNSETLHYLLDISSLSVHNPHVNAAYENGLITKERRDFLLDVEKGRDMG